MRIHSRIPDQIHPALSTDPLENFAFRINFWAILLANTNKFLLGPNHIIRELLRTNYYAGSCSSLLTFNQNLYCCPSFLFSLHSYHSFQEDLH